MQNGGRLRDTALTLAGVEGETIEFESANPRNHHHAITAPAQCPAITLDGKLFVPTARSSPAPVVMVVPGSLGVGPNHIEHAETLVGEGLGAFLIDPFGPRSVDSTVANQTQYSFAASAFDVLAALRALRARPDVDRDRISAQGHSRGGSAVTIAAMRRFADAVVGPDVALRGVYAVYPWCGQQFLDPRIGSTTLRAIVGERDEWVSVQQVQAQVHAIQLSGGAASVRVVAGAHHSFDRDEPVHTIDDAAVAPTAPTVHLADEGAVVDPRTDEADPDLDDHAMFLAAMKGGHGRTGAAIGASGPGEPKLFRDDMIAFHRRVLGP